MRSLFVLALLASVLAQNGAGQTTPDVGVASAPLGWSTNGRDLHRGYQGLKPGDPLTARNAGDLMLECPGKIVLTYTCRAETCRVNACSEIAAPGITIHSSKSLLGGWLAALLTREPKEAVVAAARVGGNPSDGVVLQREGAVHLSPALTRVLEGHYCFLLAPLPLTASQPAHVTLDWDRAVDAEGVARAPSLQPGLYALRKGSPRAGDECQLDTDAPPAWVLVAPTSDFPRLNAEWKQQAGAIASLEQSGASLAAVTTFRHAVLAQLAGSVNSR